MRGLTRAEHTFLADPSRDATDYEWDIVRPQLIQDGRATSGSEFSGVTDLGDLAIRVCLVDD